jgi:hypothetical protein
MSKILKGNSPSHRTLSTKPKPLLRRKNYSYTTNEIKNTAAKQNNTFIFSRAKNK